MREYLLKYIRIFFIGMLISFLGTLPLGTLNVAALQISVSDGVRPALYFAFGALSVEIIYVRVSLVAMHWVTRHKSLFRVMEWVAVMVVSALAVSSFIAATDAQVEKSPILSNTLHRFWLGAMMSAVNPLQIPFWFGWSAVLFSKGVLTTENAILNFYILGIGSGTLLGNLVFILGGKYIAEKLNTSQSFLNYIIGGIFAVTAIILLIKLLSKKFESGARDQD